MEIITETVLKKQKKALEKSQKHEFKKQKRQARSEAFAWFIRCFRTKKWTKKIVRFIRKEYQKKQSQESAIDELKIEVYQYKFPYVFLSDVFENLQTSNEITYLKRGGVYEVHLIDKEKFAKSQITNCANETTEDEKMVGPAKLAPSNEQGSTTSSPAAVKPVRAEISGSTGQDQLLGIEEFDI
ncbi:MAG: hypothetical protein RSB59_00370 [Clostridia bacterium]